MYLCYISDEEPGVNGNKVKVELDDQEVFVVVNEEKTENNIIFYDNYYLYVAKIVLGKTKEAHEFLGYGYEGESGEWDTKVYGFYENYKKKQIVEKGKRKKQIKYCGGLL